jgi:hypothetical protein
VSPQSISNILTSAPPSAFPGFQEIPVVQNVSPVVGQRTSPTPSSAGPVPTRFPPRKTSLGQQDVPDIADLQRQSNASSRPSSSHRSVDDSQRPLSPQSVKSAGTPTTNKPLPFIRPAEIYRRMEEDKEKEKERKSLESGRPSMESMVGKTSDRSASPAKSPTVPLEQTARRGSFGKEDAADGSRNVRPTLETVAERKSEYGFDRMINNLPSQQPQAQSTATDAPEASETVAPAANTDIKDEDDVPGMTSKRFSTSPKLPDLARMSVFGADFFSTSAAYTADAPPVPQLTTTYPAPPSPSVESQLATNTQEIASKSVAPVIGDSVQTSSGSTKMEQQATPSKVTDGTSSQQIPPIGATEGGLKREGSPMNINEADKLAKPSRPSLPGTWVSETPSVLPVENSGVKPPTPAARRILDSGEVSPVSDDEDDRGRQSDWFRAEPRNEPANAASQIKSTTVAAPVLPAPAPQPSPRSLPPLQTGSTRAITPEAVPLRSEARAVSAPTAQPLSADSDVMQSPPAAEITPTAPLNPRSAVERPVDFVAPSRLQREGTMSTVATSSPAKESDKLREEIIKSLSPVGGINAFSSPMAKRVSTGDSAGARESSYLDSVYDDYLGGNDDSPQRQRYSVRTSQGEDTPSTTTNSPLAQRNLPDSSLAAAIPEKVSELEPSAPEAKSKRFSWEMNSEQVVDLEPVKEDVEPASPPATQETPSVTADPVVIPPPQMATHSPRTAVETIPTSETTSPKLAESNLMNVPKDSSGISHQVSQASTAPGRRAGSPLLEPPSPVSVMTDKQPVNSDDDPRRLSLADEKALIQTSSNPVSPTPPPEQHPALQKTAQDTPETTMPSTGEQQSAVKILTFREILDMPNQTERIKKYDETRAQFAAMDSGLADWMIKVKSQHPEHAHVTASFFIAPGAPQSAPGMGVNQGPVSPAGIQPMIQQQQQQQQPYYQQYLNASSPNLNMPPPGRTSTGNMQMGGGQSPSSDFKHSGNQVGAKGKELLLAAGKAGKGLLSKGKNKLRGTGEKVFF